MSLFVSSLASFLPVHALPFSPPALVFGGYLLLVNLLSWVGYGLDKRRAQRHKWRISERTLLLLAVLGGSLGAFLGMRYFRHKTRHRKFRYGVPLILLLQLLLLTYLCLSFG